MQIIHLLFGRRDELMYLAFHGRIGWTVFYWGVIIKMNNKEIHPIFIEVDFIPVCIAEVSAINEEPFKDQKYYCP